MKQIKRLIAGILTVQLLLGAAGFTSSAVSEDEISQKYNSTAAYLQTLPAPSVGSIGGDWLAFGLARSGCFGTEAQNDYIQNVESYVKGIGSAKLHRNKSTENSRVIVALAANGVDARNVAGYDLTAPLLDASYVGKQGVNGVIWALLALDSYSYPVPAGTRERLITTILSAQQSNGGWGLDERIATPDVTSMAIQALAPYRYYDSDIQQAIDNALDWLVSVQTESGGYYSYDEFNPESCAQVIVALTALNIHPQTDSRFNQSGKSVIDSLLDFSVANGFEHTKGNGYNQMSTEQAYYALTAYYRFFNRQTSLYDMTDICSKAVLDYDGDGAESIKDVTYLQRYLAEFHHDFTTPQQRLADLNKNRKIDVGDVTLYQRLLAR